MKIKISYLPFILWRDSKDKSNQTIQVQNIE